MTKHHVFLEWTPFVCLALQKSGLKQTMNKTLCPFKILPEYSYFVRLFFWKSVEFSYFGLNLLSYPVGLSYPAMWAKPNRRAELLVKPQIVAQLIVQRREAIQKNIRLSFGHCPKWGGGGGFNRNPKVLWYFLFPLSFTFFLTLSKRGVGDHVPKVSSPFLPKYWVHIWVSGLTKVTSRLSKMGDTKVTSRMSKMRGEGRGSWQLLDNVQKKDAYFFGWLP